MKPDIKSTLHILGVGALIVLLLPFLIFSVPQLVGASQSYVVLSDSMEPTIEAGDVVIVDSVSPSSITEGDIVTYQGRLEGETTTHRVINVTQQNQNPRFQTKGDANEDPDPKLVGPEQLVGKVVLIIPELGYIITYVNTEVGLFAFVILPAILFILNEVYERTVSAQTNRSTDTEKRQP